jgi:hypothetical protein
MDEFPQDYEVFDLGVTMPASAMASIAAGLISLPGSEPPDQATPLSPARWVKKPSAICERPALCVQWNSTVGLPSLTLPSTRARRVLNNPRGGQTSWPRCSR